MSNFDYSKVSPLLNPSGNSIANWHFLPLCDCLPFTLKSFSVYEEIRFGEKTGTAFLTLPSCFKLPHKN